MRRHAYHALVIALILFPLNWALPFTMEPMSATVTPHGDGKIATFRVTNDGIERIAVRYRVVTRGVSPTGEEINAESTTSFAVYPARTVIEPGKTASVKVQWRGGGPVTSEQSYRFVAEEVPIDSTEKGSSGLRVLFRYVASLYLGDRAFTPQLVATVRPIVDSRNNPVLSVEIANRGTRHVIAGNLSVDLKYPDGSVYTIRPEDIPRLNGVNYLAGSEFSAHAARRDGFRQESFEVSVSYEGEY